MIPVLILGGLAATYLHKKFPKATEAVANGLVKSTVWTVKKTAELVVDHYAPEGKKKCCVEYFLSRPNAVFCVKCGSARTAEGDGLAQTVMK